MRAFADVQALVFDVFGTVVDWRSGVARESAEFLEVINIIKRSAVNPGSALRFPAKCGEVQNGQLELDHALGLAVAGHALEQVVQFGVLGHVRLHHEQARAGVGARGQ